MNEILLDHSLVEPFVAGYELEAIAPAVERVHDLLHRQAGPGSEFTGWLDWPVNHDREEFARVKAAAARIREIAEVLVVIGVGGSYLGARSALESLGHSFYNQLAGSKRPGPEIYFAGHNISSTYLAHLLDVVRDKEIAINIVSKSGTTLEPAIVFRFFRQLIEKRYGKTGARERIVATTDRAQGALKKLAGEEGYETFVVPDDVGGRYSVLTPVGLLPIAAGGIDIEEIMAGAREGHHLYGNKDLGENPSYRYAALRNILYRQGKTVELLATYEPSFHYFAEWWKQLFGESEGKEQKGIFPASASFTTDLHSLGQYIQDGRRQLFATTLWVEQPPVDLEIPAAGDDRDGLNYLAGRKMQEINAKACLGTMLAHAEGGVPNLKVTVPELTPYYYGQLVYFFEKACAISGYLLGVNPFDQPGVEAYKKKMFALLGKL